jgi:hypothetical protein
VIGVRDKLYPCAHSTVSYLAETELDQAVEVDGAKSFAQFRHLNFGLKQEKAGEHGEALFSLETPKQQSSVRRSSAQLISPELRLETLCCEIGELER